MTDPGRYHLNVYQGATFDKTFTWKDSDGNLVNLTGYTARAMVREDIDDVEPVMEFNTGGGGITLGGALGTIRLQVSATDTASLTWDEGLWDLELVSAGGVVTRLLEGPATLHREVTHDEVSA